MDAQDIRNLQEAYANLYQEQELDEGSGVVTGTAKAINTVLRPAGQTPQQRDAAVGNITRGLNVVAKPIKSVLSVGSEKNKEMIQKRRPLNQDVDLFDIIKGHLLDEGYADTEEAAFVIMANMSEEWRQSIVEAEVLAQKGGVAGSVKVKPALSIPGTSIGVGPNRPVPGTFTTTTPEQRQKISQGDTTIDRGIYKQSRVGAGPTANERQRYNTQLTLSRTPGKLMSR